MARNNIGKCKCGHKDSNHAQNIGPCLDAYTDRAGTVQVCWCNGFEQWVPRKQDRSLSTAKRKDPQFYGKVKES